MYQRSTVDFHCSTGSCDMEWYGQLRFVTDRRNTTQAQPGRIHNTSAGKDHWQFSRLHSWLPRRHVHTQQERSYIWSWQLYISYTHYLIQTHTWFCWEEEEKRERRAFVWPDRLLLPGKYFTQENSYQVNAIYSITSKSRFPFPNAITLTTSFSGVKYDVLLLPVLQYIRGREF